jgi:hypothetical protein
MPVREFPALGFDPAPGDPAVLDAAARSTTAQAQLLARSGQTMASLDSSTWVGTAADGFRTTLSELPRDLDDATRAHQETATALNGYARDLAGMQARAAALERYAEEAQRHQQAAVAEVNRIAAVRVPSGDPRLAELQSEHQAAGGRARAAGDDLEQIRAQARALQAQARAAAQAAAQRIRAATAVAGKPIDRWQDALDLPLLNADGERNGGINPRLPLDLATLQKMLDGARAAGIDPKRYAALLQQYWLVKAANEAGIDLSKWDPAAGVDGNTDNILKVYRLYGKFFLEHPELQWAGMANMIGPSFAGGFADLDSMKDFARKLSEKINSLPPAARAALPPELRELAKLGNLSANELQFFESKFLAMQKHIFIDQGSMHEAYLTGGQGAIDEMRAAGLIDDNAQSAWRKIASGDPAQIQDGNTRLLNREQNQIIDKQYNDMYQHNPPIGKIMTYGMTAAGAASIPGTKTPGQYSPLTVNGTVTLPGPVPFTHEKVNVKVTTPLPDFNIADKDARWAYITQDTLPAYQQLLRDHPDQARAIVASPVEYRLAQQRLAERWPQLAQHMVNDWDVDVGVRFGVGIP